MQRTNNIITENRHRSKIKAVRKTVFSACGGVFILAAVISLTGCVKDELHNTPHPDKGAVVVQMDWSDLLPEAVADNYILNVDGHEQTVSGSTNAVDRLAEPGEHTLTVYNKPQGITINGDIASVNEIIDGRSVGSRVEPLPDFLFSVSETVVVEKDDTLRITAKPRKWVRQLDMELSVSEGDYERIASITGTLSGVEQSLDIRKGERQGTAVTVRNDFAVAEEKCNTSFRLMVIVPAEHQTLTVNIVFANGDTQTIESDLSEQMAAFHDDNAPLTLTGSLNLPVEAGATGSISDWIVVDNGTTDIH